MPIFVYILLGIALLIALILISKVKVYVCYDDSVRVYARFLFLHFRLFPKKAKIRTKKSKKKAPDSTQLTEAHQEKPKEKNIVIKLWEMKSVLISVASNFLNKLHFKFITLRVVVACSDASKTALAYASVNQGIAYIIEFLRNISNVEVASRSDISVQSDFISQKSEFEGKIQLYIRVFPLIIVGIHSLTKYFKFKATKEV